MFLKKEKLGDDKMEDFKKVTIIGMGLIGGSIALGMKHKGFKGKITGTDVNNISLKIAEEKGAIDEILDGSCKSSGRGRANNYSGSCGLFRESY